MARDDRDHEEPDEHATDVAHVGRVRARRGPGRRDRDIEVGRPDDEVGQDGVGHVGQLDVGKARPGGAWARPCSKPTQSGFRNSGIDERHDGERRREADRSSDRGQPELDESIAPARIVAPALPRRTPSSSVLACSHQPLTVRSSGGSLLSSVAPRAIRSRELVERQGEDVAQALDVRLDQQLVVGRPEAREVEHQRLVAPIEDVVGRRVDLVGQVLTAGRRLGPLQEQAGRERALVLEAARWTGSMRVSSLIGGMARIIGQRWAVSPRASGRPVRRRPRPRSGHPAGEPWSPISWRSRSNT